MTGEGLMSAAGGRVCKCDGFNSPRANSARFTKEAHYNVLQLEDA